MRILLLDVELAPNIATVWGVYKQNIAINQILDTSRVMCYAAKWLGERQILFNSEKHVDHEVMVHDLHWLMEQADVIVHYNGDNFDIPIINREFLRYSMHPPSRFKSIDLLKTVRRNFRFTSNKLDHVADELNLGRKTQHEGHEMWLKCMDKNNTGYDKAWKTMEKYNKQDVQLLEDLYNRILPWIKL